MILDDRLPKLVTTRWEVQYKVWGSTETFTTSVTSKYHSISDEKTEELVRDWMLLEHADEIISVKKL